MASTPASRLLPKERLAGWVPKFTDLSRHTPSFNTLKATVESLQAELSAGSLKSTQIIEEYQRSTCIYNEYLGAVYQLAPGAMERAREMDMMRLSGKTLGPLHGIPVLLKDNIATPKTLGMGTTGGALALINSEPDGAPIVDKLLDAGAVIYGKATLSELAYYKGNNIRCGWSAAHGQSQSAYVRGGMDWSDSIGGHSSPLGSSSGSAIAVSAGLAPISVGTETDGSLVTPSTRASLYTLKPTHGLISTGNIIPTSARYDTAGPIGKTVKDVADLLTILVDHSMTDVPPGGYASAMTSDWSEIKIGTLNPEEWRFSDSFVKPVASATEQMLRETKSAYAKIRGLAKEYHRNVPLRLVEDFEYEGRNATQTLMLADLKGAMDNYLGSLKESKVKSLQELVDWNFAHAEEALTAEYPNQDKLEAGLNFGDSVEARERPLAHSHAVVASFNEIIEQNGLDVIIGPGDCWLSTFSAAGEFPIATLPMSYLDFNGRPIGLVIAAPRHKESTLIKVMSAWEATFPARKEPTEFLKHSSVAQEL